VAFPFPELADVHLIQLGLPDAVQAQVPGPVIETLPLLALELKVWLVGEIVNAQAVPACVTVKVWLAIVIVPVREVVLGFD
jgi:hypothetical protein